MTQRLIISIVGHTNAGKTSLIRTLLRNSHFGQVRNQPGTTRHVESAVIDIDTERQIELRDTPGLEDSSALRAYLHKIEAQGHSHRDVLEQCLSSIDQVPEFEQEIKVLKQALQAHLLLYVVDCREPAFSKYLDELAILRLASVPILPVLNFIYHPSSCVEQWRQTFAEQGLHAQVNFDTIAYDFDAEKRLYQKFQTLLEAHYSLIEHLIDKRQQDWHTLRQTACRRVAHLLFDACVCNVFITESNPRSAAIESLQQSLRSLEQQALDDILELMQFEHDDVALSDLPVSDGHWHMDLFAPETLKVMGLDAASAAATGAAIGAGLDLIFAGLSLGAATAAGATLGAAVHTGKRFGKGFINRLQGKEEVQADNDTVDLLMLRQVWLLHTLFHRGHAAQQASVYAPPKLHGLDQWPKLRSDLRLSSANLGPPQDQVIERVSTFISDELHHYTQPVTSGAS